MQAKPQIEIWFELENRCNIKCKFCYNYWKAGEIPAPKQLSAEGLIVCFNNLLTVASPSKITLSGGEPLLRKDFEILIDYLSTLKVPLILTSNGLLLEHKKIDLLMAKGVVTFEVPLHSSNPQTHNFLSGAKCFDESLDTIITLRSKGAHVVPVFVATKINLPHLNEVLKICHHLKLRQIIFNRVIPSGLAAINKEAIGIPDDSEICHTLESVRDICCNNKIKIHLGVPVARVNELARRRDYIVSASCPVQHAQKRWTIDSAGNLRRCNHSSLSIGNLLNEGLSNLKKQLEFNTHSCNSDFHPCQFIDKKNDYQVPVI